MQDGFELPTRLSVAAADCIIALSVALTRKEMVSDASKNTKISSKSNRKDVQGRSAAVVGDQKKVKPVSPASEFTRDMNMNLLLWNLLDQLIMLVQKLLAVCSKPLKVVFFFPKLSNCCMFLFSHVSAKHANLIFL